MLDAGSWIQHASLAVSTGCFGFIVRPAYYFRSRKPERGVPWLSGSLGILLALPCAFLLYTFPINPLPEPSGEHPVGVADFELVDAERTGLLGAATGEPRRLLVRVWYPASEVTDLTPRSYFSSGQCTATGQQFYWSTVFTYALSWSSNQRFSWRSQSMQMYCPRFTVTATRRSSHKTLP